MQHSLSLRTYLSPLSLHPSCLLLRTPRDRLVKIMVGVVGLLAELKLGLIGFGGVEASAALETAVQVSLSFSAAFCYDDFKSR